MEVAKESLSSSEKVLPPTESNVVSSGSEKKEKLGLASSGESVEEKSVSVFGDPQELEERKVVEETVTELRKVLHNGEHALHCEWTYWYHKRTHAKDQTKWEKSLLPLGRVATIEGFWRIYTHVKRADQLHAMENYSVFRGTEAPAWERYPDGGCWILRVRNVSTLRRYWEELLFATIGESFAEPDIVGCVLGCRKPTSFIGVWVCNDEVRFRVGIKLKSILKLGVKSALEYKRFSDSMEDSTSYHNTTLFVH